MKTFNIKTLTKIFRWVILVYSPLYPLVKESRVCDNSWSKYLTVCLCAATTSAVIVGWLAHPVRVVENDNKRDFLREVMRNQRYPLEIRTKAANMVNNSTDIAFGIYLDGPPRSVAWVWAKLLGLRILDRHIPGVDDL